MIKTTITMFISDVFIATALTFLSVILFRFLIVVKKNVGRSDFGTVESDHFFEHIVAGSLAFLGCIIGAVSSVVHLVVQNVDGYGSVPMHVEIVANIGNGLLFIAASLFILHMIKEEDSNHPFHYRHNSNNIDD